MSFYTRSTSLPSDLIRQSIEDSADLVDTEVGMAWASAVCWFGAGILDLFVPALIRVLGRTGLLCLFA